MQQPPINDYINWLRIQDSQLAMEETQLAAEEQWLQQKMWEHNKKIVARFLGDLADLFSPAKSNQPSPWERRAFWFGDKQHELEGKRAALQARRAWLQQEKARVGLP